MQGPERRYAAWCLALAGTMAAVTVPAQACPARRLRLHCHTPTSATPAQERDHRQRTASTEMQAIAASDGGSGGGGDGHDDDRSSLPRVDGKGDGCRSKPPSLMTDEDWDHVLANEQQQRQQVGADDGASVSRASPLATTTFVGLPAFAGVVHSSPTKEVVRHCMAPSSPSELLRLTKTHLAAEGSQVDEAREFGRELGDWINHSPFEDTAAV